MAKGKLVKVLGKRAVKAVSSAVGKRGGVKLPDQVGLSESARAAKSSARAAKAAKARRAKAAKIKSKPKSPKKTTPKKTTPKKTPKAKPKTYEQGVAEGRASQRVKSKAVTKRILSRSKPKAIASAVGKKAKSLASGRVASSVYGAGAVKAMDRMSGGSAPKESKKETPQERRKRLFNASY